MTPGRSGTTPMSMGEGDVEEGEGTTFMQWRERTQAEARENQPQLRSMLLIGGTVAAAAIVLGVIVFLLS